MGPEERFKNPFNLRGVVFTKYLWGFYAAIFLFMSAILTMSLWYGYRQLKKSAYAETHSIAVALDELNRRQLEAMAIPLESVVNVIQERGGLEKLRGYELDQLFIKAKKFMPTSRVRNFFAVDKEGRFIGSTYAPVNEAAPGAFSLKGSPEFDYVRTQKNFTVLSSTTSPVDQQKVLILMRNIHNKEGRFQGIIGVTKSLEEFQKFYGSLDLPYGVNFTMFRDDGQILYRYPETGSVAGKKVTFSEKIHFNSEGYLDSSGRLDGSERIGYYKFASAFGALIYVGYNTDALFSGWRAISRGAIAIFALFMVLFAVLVRIAQKRQASLEKAQAERDQREEMTRRIQQAIEPLIGQDFLRELSLQISKTFEMNNVAVGVLMPEHSNSVKFVINRVGGEWGTEYIYDLRKTPFEHLKPGELFAYPKNACRIFAQDPLLCYHNIEACMGILLQDSEKRPIGILLVYGENELLDLDLKRVVLSVFAARAGAELERIRTDEIRKEVERLRRQIEERSLQSEKLEAIGTLAEGIAHDFNNILAIILASAEKMISLHPDSNQDLHYLDSIKKACHRARHLVAQILVFSRKDDTNVQPIPMKKIFIEIMDFLRSTLPAQIRLTLDLTDCGDLVISADLNQVQQALMNLCVSSARTMGSEGGEIRIVLKRTQIKGKPYVKWVIHNSGEELARDEIEKIFDPFYAQDLGLVVVQRIITNHQGFIEVKSESGQGTDFEIFLPVNAEAREEAPSTDFNFKSAKKVMIVDDEPEIGLLIKELLEIEGLQVESFSDPLVAFEDFTQNQNQYFMIISDLSMPGMSGFEFVRKAREMNKDVSLILWSGYVQFLDQELQDLNVKVLSKPVDVQKLLMLIHSELSQQGGQDKAKESPAPGNMREAHP